MKLVFEDQGWEDYTSWLKTDRKTLARINKLIEDVRRDDEHRLVYVVTESEIIILAARYRY